MTLRETEGSGTKNKGIVAMVPRFAASRLPTAGQIGHGYTMTKLRIAILALSLLIAGCSTTPDAPRVVAPTAPLAVISPSPPAIDWRDLPLSSGSWRYRAGTNGDTSATFGILDAPAFILRCMKASRQVSIIRTGAQGLLTIRTSGSSRTLTTVGGVAVLASADRFLDEMAFSRGHVSIEAPGAAMLVMPAWAEPSRVIEDCR